MCSRGQLTEFRFAKIKAVPLRAILSSNHTAAYSLDFKSDAVIVNRIAGLSQDAEFAAQYTSRTSLYRVHLSGRVLLSFSRTGNQAYKFCAEARRRVESVSDFA